MMDEQLEENVLDGSGGRIVLVYLRAQCVGHAPGVEGHHPQPHHILPVGPVGCTQQQQEQGQEAGQPQQESGLAAPGPAGPLPHQRGDILHLH